MAPSAQAQWDAMNLVSEESPKSIVWASNGGEGSGKSYFALTAPGPIFVAAFDAYGMNRVSKSVKAGKEIKIARYPFTKPKNASKNVVGDQADKVWQQFLLDYDIALGHARTIIIDREDLAWELIRFAGLGGDSAAPKEYGPLNAEYVGLIQDAFAAGVNLGLLRGMREEWVSKFDAAKGKMVGHNTGKMIPDGMKKVPDHVDITLDHRWDDVQKSFITTIRKFPNVEYRDQEFPDLTFADMAMAAYPDSDVESWS